MNKINNYQRNITVNSPNKLSKEPPITQITKCPPTFQELSMKPPQGNTSPTPQNRPKNVVNLSDKYHWLAA